MGSNSKVQTRAENLIPERKKETKSQNGGGRAELLGMQLTCWNAEEWEAAEGTRPKEEEAVGSQPGKVSERESLGGPRGQKKRTDQAEDGVQEKVAKGRELHTV